MGADIFIIILSLAVLGGIGYLMYKGIKQRTATKKFPVFLVASIVVAIFVGLPAVGMIFYSIDDMANPAPTVTVQTKKVKITGTNSTGILKGKTSPRISVKLYDVDEEATFKTVKSDKNGKFTVTGLEENSTYKVTAKNNGKKSEAVKVTVSDIPAAAYTKLTINNHNDTGDLTIESDSNNQVQVSGESNPGAKIKFEDADNDYSVAKSVVAGADGKWSVVLDGPAKKKKKEYSVVAKINNLVANEGTSIYVKNPNYSKPVKNEESTDNEAANVDNSGQQDVSDGKTATKKHKSWSVAGNTYTTNVDYYKITGSKVYTIADGTSILAVYVDYGNFSSKEQDPMTTSSLYIHAYQKTKTHDKDLTYGIPLDADGNVIEQQRNDNMSGSVLPKTEVQGVLFYQLENNATVKLEFSNQIFKTIGVKNIDLN